MKLIFPIKDCISFLDVGGERDFMVDTQLGSMLIL